MRWRFPKQAAERRKPFVRQLSVCIGLLCLFAQLSSVFHMLVVEHARCAEHGEWVHTGNGHRDRHGIVHARPPSDGPAIGVSSGESEHDHCLACAERRKLAVQGPSTPEPDAPKRSGGVASPGRDMASHAAPLYSLAPKTSPPA